MFRKNFILNGISVFLGLIFFTSGMAKLYFEHQFPGIIGPVWLEESLAKYELGFFARFIAFAQITIGFILLTVRYRTIGAIMLLPMVLNILLVTISMNWAGTPYVLGFFLLLNLILLAADAPKLGHLIGLKVKLTDTESQSPFLFGLIWFSGYALVLASVYLSFVHLTTAYLVCATGTMFSLIPYFKAGRAGAAIKPKKEEVPEAVSA